jgi:hypothetical protein
MENRRIIMRVELPAACPEKLKATRDLFGMTGVAVYSRIIDWFTRQDSTIQAEILEVFPGGRQPDLTARVMKQIRDTPPSKDPSAW